MNSNHQKLPPIMPSLTVDLIIDILCRLPVKTLLRFRCVSKQFRSIIDGPDFINRHLQFHRSLNRRRLIVEEPGIRSNLFSIDLHSADNAFKPELPFESRGSVRVIGSCDGLLAVSVNSRTTICLWNISTRKHQILPKFWTDSHIYGYFCDGFGYDAATDDYKLVRVIKDSNYMSQVVVYSLKANSWRRIENCPPYHRYYTNQSAVLVGGALNWVLTVVDINVERRIISFDLTDEKFYEVPLPNTWGKVEAAASFYVVALEGCLCLSYLPPFETALDIWVMRQYGVKESWTKLFTLSRDNVVALTYSKSSDKVLVYEVRGAVYWHELDKKTNENVEINEWPTYISHATIYMDSLVSPLVDA